MESACQLTKNDLFAQFHLGLLYQDGEGVTQDHREAAKWYRLAAQQGYAPAQLSLGIFTLRGRRGHADYREAVKWYRLAADQEMQRRSSVSGTCMQRGMASRKTIARR